ncbi:MAG: recombinase family protein [bacterium]|nr:recombinase family protein [bacterium]
MKVALYPRVSTLEQAREGWSIGEQIERMKAYCAAKGWDVYKSYTDAGFSGASMIRPGLQSMIADIKGGKIDLVLVYKLDRLSRSQKDTLYLIEDVFLANNVHFASLTENFDTSTPFGRAMVGILSVFAQLEREQFRERSKMGKEARAKKGLYHGGSLPIGYDYENGKLVINEYEARQIREIFRLFLEGDAITSISKKMTDAGYTHKHGTWEHNENRIRYILHNELYAGWTHIGNDIVPGQHEAIISQETLDAATEKLKERDKRNPDRKSAFQHTSLLGGFLYCRQCGGRYFAMTRRNTNGKKVYEYPKYICYSRYGLAKHMVKDSNCRNKIVNRKELDLMVITQIKGLTSHPESIEQLLSEHRAADTKAAEQAALNNRLNYIKKQIDKVMDLYLIGNIDKSIISDRLSKLQAEQSLLMEKLEAVKEIPPVLSVSETKKILAEIGSGLDTCDLNTMRHIIDSLIAKIEIDNDDVFIKWKFF